MTLKSNRRASIVINKNYKKCKEKHRNKDKLEDINLFPSALKSK